MPSVSAKWLVIVVTIVLAACAPPNLPGNFGVTELPPTTSSQPPALTTPTDQASAIEQAIADLAARLNIPSSEIKIVSQETVTWPDAGLGCPKPGVAYIQVPVDGLRVILNRAGTAYEYHTGQSKIVLCESNVSKPMLTAIPLEPAIDPTQEVNMTPTTKIESGLQRLIDTAIADLANRLSIDRNTVEVISAQSVVWPDRSLGCPQPGMVYPQVLSEGFHIELRAKDQVYSYHGGEGRGPFLCEHPEK